MFNVNERLRRVAGKVMDNALPIKQDEVAVFYAGTENLDLAYAFAAECETRGIETLVQSCGDYINQAKILKAPLESFQRPPKIPEALIDVADWFIYLTGTAFDNSFYKKPELQERILEIRKASKWSLDNLLQLCLAKRTHLVAFLDPNLQQAQALSKTYSETRDLFMDSLDIDYAALSELGQRIVHAMKRGGEIHLSCPQGSDLRLKADGRAWINDDGKPTPRSSEVTGYVHNLPVGEVFVAPLEESALGVVYPKSLPGSLISGVRIEFKGREKALISAEKGLKFMKARLENATGNPYSIAEFAFGTNPCGNMLLATEKAYGTCHFAIGQNTWLGGKNECSVHWDFLIENPTVTIDDRPILKNGQFII
jgi:leucyl aminopeptidase (aminopeptidase T)